MRHGKSSWDHPELDDFQRPLATRGRNDAPRMARRFLRRERAPDVIVSSPAERAVQTAAIFASELGLSEDRLILEPRIYEASWPTLLDIVQELHDSWTSVMLVGHNPGFTQFARLLAAATPANIPTAGVAVLSLPADSWRMVHEDMQAELWFDYPKNPNPA